MRDPKVREVDRCVDNPRPETTALLNIAREYKPFFTFALHDEFHSGENIPVYCGVSSALDFQVTNRMRKHISDFGFEIDRSNKHAEMGEGFFVMKEAFGEADYSNSTFSIFSESGLVLGCELSCQENTAPRTLVATQITIGLEAMLAIEK
jgi:hypothetical protein